MRPHFIIRSSSGSRASSGHRTQKHTKFMCHDPYQLSRVERLPLQPKTQKSLNRSKSNGLLGRQQIVPGRKVEKGCSRRFESRLEFAKIPSQDVTKGSIRDRNRQHFYTESSLEHRINTMQEARHEDSQPHLKNILEFNADSQQSESAPLPKSIRVQPIGCVFLCTNCLQYFLSVQKTAHASFCRFDSKNQKQLVRKLNRLKDLLLVISQKYSNSYTSAVSKKLEKYINQQCLLEDVLLMEWFLQESGLNIGISWKQYFWVVEQLGRKWQENKVKAQDGIWTFCQ